MKKYFLPGADTGKALWLSNFVAKLVLFAVKYGIAAAEVTDMVASEAYFIFWVQMRLNFEEFKKRLTTYKNEMRDGVEPGSIPSVEPVVPALGTVPAAVAPGIFVRARSIANRIKQHHDYNEADGQDLGIEGPEFTLDLGTVKPSIRVELDAMHPVIKSTKLGLSAVEIFVQRNGSAYERLDISTTSEFTDLHALPAPGQTALWKYKAIFRVDNQQVGQFSDEVSVVVGG